MEFLHVLLIAVLFSIINCSCGVTTAVRQEAENGTCHDTSGSGNIRGSKPVDEGSGSLPANLSNHDHHQADPTHLDQRGENSTTGRGEEADELGEFFHLPRSQLSKISAAVRKRAFGHVSKTSGWRMPEMLLGIVLSLAAAAWGFQNYQSDILDAVYGGREEKTLRELKDTDVEDLKNMLGDVNLPSWIQFPDFERVAWFNLILEQLWPYVSAAAKAQVMKMLPSILEENKPRWMRSINLTRFELGPIAPQANGIKVYAAEEVSEELIAEIEFLWTGRQDIRLAIQPIPQRLPVVAFASKPLSDAITVPVAVENAIFNGRLRLRFTPLISELPVIGAVKVGLVDVPAYSFDLKVYGNEVTVLPGLEPWLYSIIRESVIR
eukprot:jgi/Botrbrau1/21682/Bobra.43_1s0078.2